MKLEYYKTREISTLKEVISGVSKEMLDKDIFRYRITKDTYGSISWRKCLEDMDALGTALLSRGFQDSNICILGENSYPWVLTYMTTVNGVGVIVPIDKELSDEEITNIINQCEGKVVVFSKSFEKVIKNIKSQCENVELFLCYNSKKDDFISLDTLIQEGTELIAQGDTAYINAEIDIKKVCAIIFTSGTTGFSKGVMLSQKNLISDMRASSSTFSVLEGDMALSILPLHHTFAFTGEILDVLLHERTVCFNESMRHLQDNMKLFKPTTMFTVPLILETLYKRIMEQVVKSGKSKKMKIAMKVSDFLLVFGIDIRKKLFADIHEVFGGNIKTVYVGGAAMDPEITKVFQSIGILVLQGYGITECSPFVSTNMEQANNDKSVGLVVPCCEVKIQDGEILVKGDNVMLGYYKNEEATKAVFDGEWFKTGDLGYFDKKGFLYITGRIKNVIILDNGKNVYPEELEAYIKRVEHVNEVLVYGIDNIIYAEIFPNLEIPNVQELIKEQIDKLNKKLPVYKQVNKVIFRESDFKKTTSHKVKRNQGGKR